MVDLSGLDLIDSSGVAGLVALYKRVRAQGGQVIVSGARDQPLAIFKLLRMDKVFLL
jgi:anti-sigma B factor antagonist